MNPPEGYRLGTCCATCQHYKGIHYEADGHCMLLDNDDGYFAIVEAEYICNSYEPISAVIAKEGT